MITKEEFIEYCKSEEGKIVLAEQAKENGFIPESTIEGLTANRDSLKSEKLTLQKKFDKVNKELDSLKNEFKDYQDVRGIKENSEKKILEMKALHRDIEAKLKAETEEKENLQKKLDNTTKKWYKDVKGRALDKALGDINVLPAVKSYIANSFLDRVDVKIDEVTGDIIGTSIKDDKGLPQKVGDFFKTWSETKPTLIIDKNASTGGGAGGSGNFSGSASGQDDSFFSKDDFKE